MMSLQRRRTVFHCLVTFSCALGSLVARGAVAAEAMPDVVRREGLHADDWKKLTTGEIVAHVASAQSQPPQSFAAGAVIIAVPWQHAFAQIGRVEEMPRTARV